MSKVKELMKNKEEPKMDNKQAGSTVKQLLSKSMKKGKVKSLKLKVKMK